MLRRRKLAHVRADLGDHTVCGDSIDAWNSHQEFDFVLKGLTAPLDLLVEFSNFRIEKWIKIQALMLAL